MLALRLPLSRAEWSFEFQWILATVVGWVIGFALCEVVKAFFLSFGDFSLDGLIIGISVGTVQYLALRHIKGMRAWILVTVIGFAIGKILGDAIAQALPNFVINNILSSHCP